jgi:hypothetical protein
VSQAGAKSNQVLFEVAFDLEHRAQYVAFDLLCGQAAEGLETEKFFNVLTVEFRKLPKRTQESFLGTLRWCQNRCGGACDQYIALLDEILKRKEFLQAQKRAQAESMSAG